AMVGLGQAITLGRAGVALEQRLYEALADLEGHARVVAQLIDGFPEQVLGNDPYALTRREIRFLGDVRALHGDVHRGVAHSQDDHPLTGEDRVLHIGVCVQLLAGEFLGAGEGGFGPAWIPVVAVGDQQRVVHARLAALELELPGAVLAPRDVLHTSFERDLLAEPEVVDVVLEVGGDLRVVGKVRIGLGHREVRVLHARTRGVDEQVAIGRRHAVLVREHPVAADPIGLLQAVERDRALVQRLGRGDARGARADDAGAGEAAGARSTVFRRLADHRSSVEEIPSPEVLVVGDDARPDVVRRTLGAFVGIGVAGQALVRRQRRSWGALSVAPPGEVAVDHARALAPLVDRPHDQRLAATSVAGAEHALHGACVGLGRLDVAPWVLLHAQLVEQLLFGMQEAHRQQHQLRLQLALGARHRSEWRRGLGLGDVQRGDPAVAIVGEAGRHDRVVLLAGVGLLRLLHRIAEAVLQRPLRPRRAIVGTARRRLGQKLQLRDRARALPQRGGRAVRARVATADHHDVAVLGADLPLRRRLGDRRSGTKLPRHPAVALVEVVHREVHASQLPARHGQVAGHARACRKHDRVELAAQLLHAHVAPDVDAAAQLDSLLDQLLHAALHDGLFDLEVRDPEAHQPTDRLVALEQRHAMAGAAQLLGRRHARRSRAHHGDRLAALRARGPGHDPPFLPAAIDDRVLDLFDRDRVALANLEHARRLTRRRTQPPGELGEVVRRVQLVDRVAPAVAVDEIVPIGDQVSQRAAVVAEGHAAVHAASALLAQLRDGAGEQELPVVVGALARVPLRDPVALYLQKGPELAHQAGTASCWPIFDRSVCSPQTRL